MSQKVTIPRSRLLERTVELLEKRPKEMTLRRIENDTKLPEGWLVSLQCNREISPSVDRIVILYEYLSGNTLIIV